MSGELASEIWNELKRYINTVDRSDAAEIMVSVLIDNDINADEIKKLFKGDNDIKRALVDYAGNHDIEEFEEVEEEVDEEVDEDDY